MATSAGGATSSTERSASKPTLREPSGRPGRRQQQGLELVRQRPGVTVGEIGGQLGVDPTSLERVVHRLEEQGAINEHGRELRPAYAHPVRARFTSGVLSLET
jgi:MarR family